MGKIVRSVIIALSVLLGVGAAAAQDIAVRHGLMWNRTGLPAVFPLQVKTAIGQDYFITLQDAETGDAALAAFIKGGRFFRVLVPPGTFRVHVAYGVTWQGEDRLFGTGGQTQTATLKEPLVFKVKNFRTKGGHQLDLRQLAPGLDARILTAPDEICQTARFVKQGARDAVPLYLGHAAPDTLTFYPTPLEAAQAALRLDLEDGLGPRRQREPRRDHAIEVRTRPC